MADAVRSYRFDVPMMAILLGTILIVASFLPLSSLSNNVWTKEDSKALSFVSQEMHHSRSTFSTKEDQIAYHDKLKSEFEKLKIKLEDAQHEPQRWSRIFLWSGASLAAIGALMHLAKQDGQTLF